MSTAISAWKLIRPNGRPTRCLLSVVNGYCDVIVWNGPSIVLWERHRRTDDAARRADELWTILVAYGCQPMPHESSDNASVHFRRACPECLQQTAAVRYRRGEYLVLNCGVCGQLWHARERNASFDRRAMTREGADRRKAA
jgi:hypothetical protein